MPEKGAQGLLRSPAQHQDALNQIGGFMLSIIIPVYNEAENLKLLHPRLSQVLKDLHADYELIYVDDDSRDNSLGLLKEFSEVNPKVKLIHLARNFGQTLAIQAGIDNSCGDKIVIIGRRFSK